MKKRTQSLSALAAAAVFGLVACGDGDHDHDHGDHDHAKPGESAEKHEHDHEHDHEHEKIIAGPNGGRVLTGVEPHAEFFVTAERKIQIAFVDDKIQQIPVAEQTVKVVAGDRKAPTNLSFERSGDVLISEQALPEGELLPIVVQIQTTPDAKLTNEKFNLNMAECPTCDYKEYACICDHGDHDHDEEDK